MSAPLRQNTNWAAYVPTAPRNCIAVEAASEHPKFKSRICRHWLKGYCRLGEQCAFAHGWDEKRSYMNQAGRPEHMFLELGNEEMEIITDWHELGKE
tara:strand:+ start:327 stop:617 length:291 start_codon:yes stop_codon:yes gene_type:complete